MQFFAIERNCWPLASEPIILRSLEDVNYFLDNSYEDEDESRWWYYDYAKKIKGIPAWEMTIEENIKCHILGLEQTIKNHHTYWELNYECDMLLDDFETPYDLIK